ncbi:hypothetical protein ACF090_20195 [Streptomyces sp. NPDC014892]|uniref:hypothetical protein n=1 Tax=Streptomyces sp. NPDC014892 TaxID=3364930 RepID=UPI0036FAF34B
MFVDVVTQLYVHLLVLRALGLVPVIRRLRGSDSSVRFEARLDLLDVVSSALLLGGLLLSLAVAEFWFWLPSPVSRSWLPSTPSRASTGSALAAVPRPDPNGRRMPGLTELEDGYERIEVRYRDRPDGAILIYEIEEPALVDALHDWFDAQLSDHGDHAESGH